MRLFFALWPDAKTRSSLAATAGQLKKACGGRSPPAENLHLTLAFLGHVAANRMPELRLVADAVIAEPFELTLAQAGYWRAQRLAWAAPLNCPHALTALHGQLTDALRLRGFHTERRAFKPHVTLLRDAAALSPSSHDGIISLRWPLRDFVLACSEPVPLGVQYRVIGTWPLNAARL
jgi:2'-5' RNA ligase